jgi:glucokinase
MASSPYVLAFDVGGTKLAAAVFDLDHRRLCKVQSLPAMARQRGVVTLMNLKRVGEQARKMAGVEGPPQAVGMGSPGPLDTRKGRLLAVDNLPNLAGFDMAGFILQEFGASLHLENDANCFALGEALQGAGRGKQVVVGVTLGTGFGCGIVIDGKILTGVTDNAGEVAYCPVSGGTFDQMLSGGGVQRFFARVTGKDPPSAKEIGELAEQGDPGALEAWRYYGEAVGTGLGTISAILDPSIVVLGGSVARRLPLFREPLERKLRSIVAPPAAEKIEVAAAQLDTSAGVAGAAEYALQHLRSPAARRAVITEQ